MKVYDADHIRNVALVGHQGSGKTMLAEAMLLDTGAIKRMGTIEEGNTISDYHPSEKERGMSVSMDDFGTGYSSLSFMAKLPLDNLKVDRSFVMHLPEDRDAATLVRTIVTMAQQLGLAVIAEGIETASQEAFLSALGCEMGQGYLFGKPMEPSDFEDLVRNGL